jgi:hypothetical protein
MSSAVASALPLSNGQSQPSENGISHDAATSTSNGSTATASAPAAGLPQASMSSIPPHVQQMLKTMNEEKLQQMVARMRALQSAGETEQSSQEYSNLLNTFRYFQQVKSMRQQQGESYRDEV